MAEEAVSKGEYAKAAECYRKEAAVYRKLGDPNAAKVEEMKADRWSTEIDIFVDAAPAPDLLKRNYTGAKHEPAYGCYLGAYLPMDDNLGGELYSGRQEDSFGSLIGRKLSTSFVYCRWGQQFPSRWARALSRKRIIPHIAWEPNRGLDAVLDDAYLRQFARDAARCGGPVFIRFAGEMNGDWTKWSRQPQLYRAKFRLVHDVMERYAPNAAMIWCVNHIPQENITDFYPGDEYVDWVGVNFYSVPFHDNDPSRLGLHECPTSFLKYVYNKYSAKKPIAICEWGASHQAACEPGGDRTDFAVEKITQMFSALPRLYPRVKLIDYFDCNNLQKASPGRQLSNYCVTDNETILSAFRKAVSPSYYLSPKQACAQTYIRRLSSGAFVTGTVRLSAWVKSYEPRPTVIYSVDAKRIATISNPGEYRTTLNTSNLSNGKHTISLTVLDSQGKVAGSRQLKVEVRDEHILTANAAKGA